MRIQKLTKNTLGVTRKVFKGIILLVILSKLSRKEKKWFGRLGCENNVQIFWRVDKTGAAKRAMRSLFNLLSEHKKAKFGMKIDLQRGPKKGVNLALLQNKVPSRFFNV
jgi:hypothetical protein